MIKKLLMNNYSRNGLMPVQDGLICWLDSRDGFKNNIMIDRIGNCNAKVIGNVDGFRLIDNSIENYGAGSKLITEKPMKIGTVMKTQKITSYGAYGTCFDFSSKELVGISDTLKISFRNNDKIGFYQEYPIAIFNNGISPTINKKGTIAITPYSIFYNDNKVDFPTKTVLSNSELIVGISLALGVGTNAISENFYSMLIYNRVLTDAEIQQNCEYENSIERG